MFCYNHIINCYSYRLKAQGSFEVLHLHRNKKKAIQSSSASYEEFMSTISDTIYLPFANVLKTPYFKPQTCVLYSPVVFCLFPPGIIKTNLGSTANQKQTVQRQSPQHFHNSDKMSQIFFPSTALVCQKKCM